MRRSGESGCEGAGRTDSDARAGEGLGAEWRDAELGSRLRGLAVPEHGPAFFTSLSEGLEAEARRSAPAADTRRATGAGASLYRAGMAKPRRRWLRLAWVPIPVAAMALLLLWALAGPLGLDLLQPERASAAEISQKAATAVAGAQTVRGTLVIGSPDGSGTGRDEMRWTFISTAAGDFRLTGLTQTEDLSYAYHEGVQRIVSGGEDGEPVFASERTGMAAGLPDPAPAEYVLQRRLGAAVRALLGSYDASVAEVTHEGRPAWTVSLDVPVNLLVESSADHMEVTVDQETGYPVRVLETRQGEFVQEMHLEGLDLDPALPEGAFHLEFPEGAEVTHTDDGFLRVDPAEIAVRGAAVVGYEPLLPRLVPTGFALAEVAVAAQGQPTGKEGMNPAASGVVSALYKRGFDRLVISTRLVGPDAGLWSDPLASGEGFIDVPETVLLRTGAFAGSTAELLLDARAVPHLWAMDGTLVLTVSGDLTRDELLAVAESLAPVE